MEDTLRELQDFEYVEYEGSLNPCFNGRYSQREKKLYPQLRQTCLNPCFNGRYSQRAKTCVPLFIVV